MGERARIFGAGVVGGLVVAAANISTDFYLSMRQANIESPRFVSLNPPNESFTSLDCPYVEFADYQSSAGMHASMERLTSHGPSYFVELTPIKDTRRFFMLPGVPEGKYAVRAADNEGNTSEPTILKFERNVWSLDEN